MSRFTQIAEIQALRKALEEQQERIKRFDSMINELKEMQAMLDARYPEKQEAPKRGPGRPKKDE